MIKYSLQKIQYIADYYFQYCVEVIFVANVIMSSFATRSIGWAFIESVTLWLLVDLMVYIWYRVSFKRQRKLGINRYYLLTFIFTVLFHFVVRFI